MAAMLMGLTLPFFLTIIHVYVYLRFKERFLSLWAASWMILFVRAILTILAIATGNEDVLTFLGDSGSTGSGITLVQLPPDRNDGQCHCGAAKHSGTVVAMATV